jgi:hypothetical protein
LATGTATIVGAAGGAAIGGGSGVMFGAIIGKCDAPKDEMVGYIADRYWTQEKKE